MEDLVLFFLSFLFVFLLYEIFIVSPRKKNRNKKKEIIEIRYLEARYSLDMKNIPYAQLLQICAIVSSIDIAVIVTVISKIDQYWLMMLVGFIMILFLILISYYFVYLFYKKKGMIIDGKRK
jgi:hypothetical protein